MAKKSRRYSQLNALVDSEARYAPSEAIELTRRQRAQGSMKR